MTGPIPGAETKLVQGETKPAKSETKADVSGGRKSTSAAKSLPGLKSSPPPSKQAKKIIGVLPKTIRTLADLADDPENPREIEPENREALGVSLSRFGDLSGLTYNRRTGHMIAGHQRKQQLGALAIQFDGQQHFVETEKGDRFNIRGGPACLKPKRKSVQPRSRVPSWSAISNSGTKPSG